MNIPDFNRGLVFGFDVGTDSIGYAVRQGAKFLDVGVVICNSEGGDLSNRRNLRRVRRTLRSRKYRRRWFANELEKLGLPRPEDLHPDPVCLRLRAVNGEELKPEELHNALTHLFKRRGYFKVPWANEESSGKENEEGEIKKAVAEIKEKVLASGCQHPCQYLAKEKDMVGKTPMDHWARKIHWPRELLCNEFLAILKAQKERFPKLAEQSNWLLYGDTNEVSRNGHDYHVYFKTTETCNPGILGLRWPRFDNRRPSSDSFQPVDEEGRPLHVARKSKTAFTISQWELALMKFRVLDAATRQKRDPRLDFPEFIQNLQNEWNKKGKVTAARLQKIAAPFKDKFFLFEKQPPLTPETGKGRAKYSSPTLEYIRGRISAGKRVDPPQPVLMRKGESPDQALNRCLSEINHPLVKHRLALFRRLLEKLSKKHRTPDMIIMEVVRSLALGQKAKNELNKRNENFRKQREQARAELAASRSSISRKAIQRYRLWQETRSRCPFCLNRIERADLGHGAEIVHLVPRAIVDCNELYNLTVAHVTCNRDVKKDRTPFAAFGETSQWPDLKRFAESTFTGRKLEIFLSPNAEELIEQKADLQHTAYIARVFRHISLIQLGWLNEEGRDPTPEKQNSAYHFQVTNGQLTYRLRKAWGLNQILHPLPAGTRWEDLTEEEQKQHTEKNSGDLRHHALDAVVIACTLPWLAHRTHGAQDDNGRHGWWTQDENERSQAANLVFPRKGQMHAAVKKKIKEIEVLHHASRSMHKRTYGTTIYGIPKKQGAAIPNCYVSRKPITALKPNELKSPKTGKSMIYPSELGNYLFAAWNSYCGSNPDWETQLNANKNCLPDAFQKRLCFSAFQRWRANEKQSFTWPDKITIPIKRIGYIGVEDHNAVALASPGTNGYVIRKRFREVHLFISEDGKSLVPVFIPIWRLDKPVPKVPIKKGSKPIVAIRRGQIVEIKNPPGENTPKGRYRVASTMQRVIQLLPVYLANKKDTLKATGFLGNGVNISWDAFIKAAGYELPHSPSAQ